MFRYSKTFKTFSRLQLFFVLLEISERLSDNYAIFVTKFTRTST